MDLSVAVNVPSHLGGKPNSKELLGWLNKTLQTDFRNVEQVCTGAAFCQLMDWCFPGSLDLYQVRFLCESDEDSHFNYSILQAAFCKVGVLRFIPIETLVEKNSVAGLAFLHWFRMFFEKNQKGKEYHPVEARGRQMMHPVNPDRDASEAPHQALKIKEEVTEDSDMEEAQSQDEEKEDTKENVINLISDEDDIIDVATEQETEKMETAVSEGGAQVKEEAEAAEVTGNQRMSLNSAEALQRFIRRYCSDINTHPALLSLTHSSDIIQACYLTPYCLYLYMGVELGEGQTTSVLLVGYFDQSSEASVVRPLLTLQMSVDTPASMDTGSDITTQTGDADARLLVYRLKTSGLPSSNLAMFYCNAPNPELCQGLVSALQGLNPQCLSFCGLSEMAERACHAALMASFHQVVHLIKDIHRHYSTRSSLNPNLQHLFADVGCESPSHPLSKQFLFTTRCVQRMLETWGGLVDYFKSLKRAKDALRIRTQLMDHKIKLYFLFLAHALEPLQALQEFQQQDTTDVAAQLKMASMLVNSYASNLLVLSVKESFVGCRDLQLLHDQKNVLPSSKLNIGPGARDFLGATAVRDLGEQDRKDFLDYASTFYKVALQSLAGSVPKQLGDMALRNISIMLKHPEDPKVYMPRAVVSGLGNRLSFSQLGKEENGQLVRDYFRVIKKVEKEQESGWGEGQSWPKLLHSIQQNCGLYRLILGLLTLPSSLQRDKVFAQIRAQVEEIPDHTETPKVSPEASRSREKCGVRRRYRQAGHNDDKKDDETSLEEEDISQIQASLQPPPYPTYILEKSDYTDNSSGSRTPPAEIVYVVGEDDSKVSRRDWSDSARSPGELVWTVVDGFVAWPAIISSKDKRHPEKRMVWRYGQSMNSQVSVQDLKPFAVFAEHFCPNSFAVLATYRDAISVSLQEAALRCQKEFSEDPSDKREQLTRMLEWAIGGFLPTGPDGFRPVGAQNGVRKKPHPESKASTGLHSSLISSKSSVPPDSSTPGESKTAREEEFDSAGKVLKRVRGIMDADTRRHGRGGREEFGGGRGAGSRRGRGRGGKVHQKRTSPFDGSDSDMSPDLVPCKRTLTKPYNKAYQTTGVFTQPDQQLRDEVSRSGSVTCVSLTNLTALSSPERT